MSRGGVKVGVVSVLIRTVTLIFRGTLSLRLPAVLLATKNKTNQK